MIGLRALLVLGILCSVRGQVGVREKHAWVGSDVVLKCSVDIQDRAVTQVTWRRKENKQNVDFLTYDGSSGIKKLTRFAEERVELLGNGRAGESIKVRNVALTDESVYTCIFTTFPSGEYQNVIYLVVQAKPDIHLEPPPDPRMVESPYQTVAICVAEAAKPAAKITWLTDGLEFACSEREIQHGDGTMTTESQLRMIPGAGMKGRSVTCIISQDNGLSLTQTERKLTIRNVQYPPDSVRVEVKILDNGAVQFICVEDSSPPATKFIWKRKATYDSDAAEELGNGKMLSGENFHSGVYICEVTNPIGKSSGSLYFYKAPGSSARLNVSLWPLLFLALCVFLYLGYKKQPIIGKKN